MATNDPLMQVAKSALENQIAPRMREILLSHIQSDVYGTGSQPKEYKRRGSLDEKSLVTRVTQDGSDGFTVFVTSVAEPAPPATGWSSNGDGAFLYMLELGDLGWYRKDFPRPAISNAQKEIDKDAQIKSMLRQFGFIRR